MALPELPDDRRARPQRIAPQGRSGGRHSVRTPPNGQPPVPEEPRGRRSNVPDWDPELPRTGPHDAVPRNGTPRRRPDEAGRPANGSSPNGSAGPARYGPARPDAGRHGAPSNGSPRNGAAPNGAAPNGVTPNGVASNGFDPRAARRPVDGAATARPPRTTGAVPAPRTAPRRRPDPDDEPTEVHGPLAADPGPGDDVDPEAPTTATPQVELPGRHRRRAGASPEGRPAAAFKAQADAVRTRKARPGRRRRPAFWKELPLLIVVALLLTFLIQTFLAKVYVIPSGSMETTLHGCNGCNNDRVLVDKVTYRFGDPQPGDVVVFRGPDSWTNTEFSVERTDNALVNGLQQLGSLIGLAPPDEKDFVKRVIAVGGQTVQCCDSRDRVLVDGEPLDEPYIYYLPQAGPPEQDEFEPVTVPEGYLWMMGDSRNNSSDSRAPGHGPVPVANVIGQARLIVLPFGRFGWIDATDPQTTAVGMGEGAGTPIALGLLGTLPLAVWRRRRASRDEASTFLI